MPSEFITKVPLYSLVYQYLLDFPSASLRFLTALICTAIRSSMAEIIKSLISSITTRFNGNSSVPHDHPNQSKSDGHPVRPKPDFSLTAEIVESEELLKDLFERWLSFYDLSSKYHHDKAKRFELFKESARYSHELNMEDSGCTYGVNQFSAMTPEEFESQCLGLRPPFSLQRREEEEEEEEEE